MPDFSTMTPTEFSAWQVEQNSPPVSTPPHFAGEQVTPFAHAPAPTDKYAPTTWGQSEFDFVTPSGQTCRMRKVPVEDLVEMGLLDKLNTLSPRVDALVAKSNGEPPQKQPENTDSETMRAVIGIMNDIIPVVVLQPKVHRNPEDETQKQPGLIYVSDVDLADRLAILNQTMGGLEKLANFRE